MLTAILVAALVSSGQGHCLDSYLAGGMHQQRPAREIRGGRVPSTAGDTVTRIDRVIAPPGDTIGFLYTTADGGRFFGTRTRAHEPAADARTCGAFSYETGLLRPRRSTTFSRTRTGTPSSTCRMRRVFSPGSA